MRVLLRRAQPPRRSGWRGGFLAGSRLVGDGRAIRHIAPARRRGLGRGGRTQEDRVGQGPPAGEGPRPAAPVCQRLDVAAAARNRPGAMLDRGPCGIDGGLSRHHQVVVRFAAGARQHGPALGARRGGGDHGLPRPLPLSASDHGHPRGHPHRDERAEGHVRTPHECRPCAPRAGDHGPARLTPDQRPWRHPDSGPDRGCHPRQGHPHRRGPGRVHAVPRLGHDPCRPGGRPAGGHTLATAGDTPQVAGQAHPGRDGQHDLAAHRDFLRCPPDQDFPARSLCRRPPRHQLRAGVPSPHEVGQGARRRALADGGAGRHRHRLRHRLRLLAHRQQHQHGGRLPGLCRPAC